MLIKSLQSAHVKDHVTDHVKNRTINDRMPEQYLNAHEQTVTRILNELFHSQADDHGGHDKNGFLLCSHKQDFLLKLTEQLQFIIDDPELNVGQLAKDMAVSERQLYRNFKLLLNTSPGMFVKSCRLEKAYWLMKQGETIGNIAFMVGFSSHSYFSRCFKNKYGLTPSDCVKNLTTKYLAEN